MPSRLRQLRDRFTAPEEPVEAWLDRAPWEQVELSERLAQAPSMMVGEERQLLFALARDHPLPGGCIVDAGCFLGGSTLSFALGLRARPDGRRVRLATYDRFILDYPSAVGYPQWVEGLQEGDSMRPRFESVLGDELELAEVHEGDILQEHWAGDPIDVLFVDVAKSWGISDHVHREWLPALTPGTGVLVQQDYVHEWCPWLHVLVELLGDRLELKGVAGGNSAVFACKAPIPVDAVPANLRAALTPDEMLTLFDRSAERFSGQDRGVIECARAVLLKYVGRPEAARRQLDVAADRWGNAGPRMPIVIGAVRPFVAA